MRRENLKTIHQNHSFAVGIMHSVKFIWFPSWQKLKCFLTMWIRGHIENVNPAKIPNIVIEIREYFRNSCVFRTSFHFRTSPEFKMIVQRVGSQRWNWKFREKYFWNSNPELLLHSSLSFWAWLSISCSGWDLPSLLRISKMLVPEFSTSPSGSYQRLKLIHNQRRIMYWVTF